MELVLLVFFVLSEGRGFEFRLVRTFYGLEFFVLCNLGTVVGVVIFLGREWVGRFIFNVFGFFVYIGFIYRRSY